ncbi:AAA family ATPase [Pantoea cypripedii]|uniref:ATPase AAA-type core domain-containing protein n=1 Tax=Pantoea cypripedii TaxID=55209 RepID=A0A6B9FXT2_PANCY|nr:AAA family ATPase [Pantoea cypripedii]QGY29331.1 hypothetical protein CUN67_10465 [Pantoea cypripedii]
MDIFYTENFQKLETVGRKGFHLVKDNTVTGYHASWDDFGYQTMFYLFYVSDKTYRLGLIRLLFNGHENTSRFLTSQTYLGGEDKSRRITGLLETQEHAMLGTSIELYRKLGTATKRLGITRDFLMTMNDLSRPMPVNERQRILDWPGVDRSLMRNELEAIKIINTGFKTATEGYQLWTKNHVFLNSHCFKDLFDIRFNLEDVFPEKYVALLIGKNGTGKTHLLKEICEKYIGHDFPDSGGLDKFNKLIVVAYSPFENYPTTVESIKENYNVSNNKLAQLRSLNLKAVNYEYIGFKNGKGVFDLDYPSFDAMRSLLWLINYDREEEWWDPLSRFSLLWRTLSLTLNFDAIGFYTHKKNLIKLDLQNYLKQKIDEIDERKGFVFLLDDEVLPLSSGQKIYSYMIPAIIAAIDEASLLLIDEPELYLHPALEVGLIDMLKELLKSTRSCAIISTHSAVIAREVSRPYVYVLKRDKQGTSITSPEIETLGATLDEIIGEVFDDNRTIKSYQRSLDNLLKERNPQEIIKAQSEEFGDSALIYLLTKQNNNAEINISDEE